MKSQSLILHHATNTSQKQRRELKFFLILVENLVVKTLLYIDSIKCVEGGGGVHDTIIYLQKSRHDEGSFPLSLPIHAPSGNITALTKYFATILIFSTNVSQRFWIFLCSTAEDDRMQYEKLALAAYQLLLLPLFSEPQQHSPGSF